MISYVKGSLAYIDTEQDMIIVDVQGLGYGVFVPNQLLSQLPRIGSEILLHTYMNVREDLMQLFGFLHKDDLEVFKLVIGVSGIGPKSGLNILSLMSPDELRFAVIAGDVKAISKAQGIGKKTAEKLIVELRDKLKMPMVHDDDYDQSVAYDSSSDTGVQAEAIQALTALGYGSTESLKAVRNVLQDGMKVEEVLKLALRNLM